MRLCMDKCKSSARDSDVAFISIKTVTGAFKNSTKGTAQIAGLYAYSEKPEIDHSMCMFSFDQCVARKSLKDIDLLICPFTLEKARYCVRKQ